MISGRAGKARAAQSGPPLQLTLDARLQTGAVVD